MQLVKYYSQVFGSNVVSVLDHIRTIDTVITEFVKNLPTEIYIVQKNSNVANRVSLISDETISYKEYALLQTVLSQYTLPYDDTLDVTCKVPGSEEFVPIRQVLDSNPGMFKLLHSVLFLDFYSSLDFMNNTVALYELMTSIHLKKIPSSDKKDAYMRQKEVVQEQIRSLQGEFDLMSVDYQKFSKSVDDLSRIVGQIETEIALSNEDMLENAAEVLESNPSIIQDSKKIGKSLQTVNIRLRSLQQKDLDISRLSQVTESERESKELVQKRISQVTELQDRLETKQQRLLDQIDQEASERMTTSISSDKRREVLGRLSGYKESLLTAESRRKESFDHMSDLKEKINALKLETLEIEDKIRSEGRPVDLNRIISENILELDKEITVTEKAVRFLKNYFAELDGRGFFTVLQRRHFLQHIFPDLKIKSINLLPGPNPDSLNFIQVVG